MSKYRIYPSQNYSFTASIPRIPADTADTDLYTLVDDPYDTPDTTTYILSNTYTSVVEYRTHFALTIDPPGMINYVRAQGRFINIDGGSTGSYKMLQSVTYGGWIVPITLGDVYITAGPSWADYYFDSTAFSVYGTSYKWEWSHIPLVDLKCTLKAGTTGRVACTQLFLEVDYTPFTVFFDSITVRFSETIIPVTLYVSETLHTHSVDNIVLSMGYITMIDSDHLQVSDNITLIPLNVTLSTDDTHHEQLADIILFNIAIQDLADLDTYHLHVSEELELTDVVNPTTGDLVENLPSLTLLAGTGIVGSISIPALTITITASVDIYVSGDIVLPVFDVSANSGAEVQMTFTGITIDATGSVGVVGSSTLQLPVLSATASGVSAVGGSASLHLSGLTVDGTGTSSAIVTLSANLPVFGIDASGVVGILSNAIINLPVITLTGMSKFDVSCSFEEDMPFIELVFTGSNKSRFTGYILRWIR